MLVLSRKEGEQIVIGGKIRITICQITPSKVRVGIDAPNNVSVSRSELLSKPSWCTAPNGECCGVPLAHLERQQIDQCDQCPFCDRAVLREEVSKFVANNK